MTQTIFGMFCRDEKEGPFFLTKGKSKQELWPFIKHHCHPETHFSTHKHTFIKHIFSNAVHKSTNHKLVICVEELTQTSSEEESDLDPLSYIDNCDEDPDWENC
ncbi:hypothetical protein CEXT_36351 [Caerostris extrusa]|uniref:Uncharacterized protein n=1 Tax=Caerostris extrusa TaxID=172846 RepID=A0AAV4T4P7_CAEEX|nr:hypothetical protein CEXT_36351 [Caerostris extrusa]